MTAEEGESNDSRGLGTERKEVVEIERLTDERPGVDTRRDNEKKPTTTTSR